MDQGSAALALLSSAARPGELFNRSHRPDWEAMFAQHHPFLRLRKIEGLAHCIVGAESPLRRLYDRIWQIQFKHLVSFASAAEERGIKVLTFKGAEHFSSLNHSRAPEFLSDLDVLVAESDLATTKEILQQQGFRQSYFNRTRGTLVEFSTHEIQEAESAHYELVGFNFVTTLKATADELEAASGWNAYPLFSVGDDLKVVTSIDVHHRVALEIASDELTERAIRSSSGAGFTLCESDHYWVTAARYYVEVHQHAKRSLRDLFYMSLLARSGRIDWDFVAAVTEQLDVRPALFYVSRLVAKLSDSVPPEFINRIDPRLGSRDRDWGSPSPVLLNRVAPEDLGLWPTV